MALTLEVGQTNALSITVLDTNGQPITNPTFDTPPAWTNTTPATETLATAADDLTSTLTAAAVGTDVVNLSVTIGGATFTASLDVTVTAVPQVPASVEIVTGPPQGV